MSKKHTIVDADKWEVYTILDFLLAFTLVVVAMATAEPPRPRPVVLSRQSAPPYNARGWRPSGAPFNLPSAASQQQAAQQTYGAPAPSYGPPPDDSSVTDAPTTTDYPTDNPSNQFLVEAENIELDPREEKPKPKKTGKDGEQPKAPLLLFLPQKQNLVYAAVPKQASVVAAVPQAGLAKLQTVPATFQILPYSSAFTSSVYTPYSASVVQSFYTV